jgi:hypothetical protein
MKKHIYDFLNGILDFFNEMLKEASVGAFIMTLVGGVVLLWIKALDFLQELDWYDGYGWIGILLFVIYIFSFFVTLYRLLNK